MQIRSKQTGRILRAKNGKVLLYEDAVSAKWVNLSDIQPLESPDSDEPNDTRNGDPPSSSSMSISMSPETMNENDQMTREGFRRFHNIFSIVCFILAVYAIMMTVAITRESLKSANKPSLYYRTTRSNSWNSWNSWNSNSWNSNSWNSNSWNSNSWNSKLLRSIGGGGSGYSSSRNTMVGKYDLFIREAVSNAYRYMDAISGFVFEWLNNHSNRLWSTMSDMRSAYSNYGNGSTFDSFES